MDESTKALNRVLLPVVAFFGLLSAGALLVLPALGGIVAGVHLAAVVGLPPAQALRGVVSSRLIRLALAVALSLAVSALSFQVLFWLGYAQPPAVVALATVYSLLLGWLMPSTGTTTAWRIGGSV